MSPTARPTLLAAVAALALALPSPGAAQSSKADAFAGKIPPVSGHLYRKAGRFEATATGNVSLNDAFFTKYFGGLKLGYHLDERWYAGVSGAGGAAVQTNSAVVCTAAGGCASADAAMMRQVPGRLRYIVGIEGAYAPVYGKLNVFSEQVAHFDLSLILGLDRFAYDEVLAASVAATRNPAVASSFGGHLGLGFRLFFGESVAVRVEVKDYLYAVKVPNLGSGSDLQNQLFAELGVSFFFPGRSRPHR